MPTLEIRISWEDIVKLAAKSTRLVKAVESCWWKLGNPVYQLPKGGTACGPKGESLVEMDSPMRFIEAAEKNPGQYGKYGLLALVAAYHGNIVRSDGIPTSVDSWDKINKLIDKQYSDPSWCQNTWPKL